MTNAGQGHVPAMLGEVMKALAPRDGGIYVDATFGAGGYARAILGAADCFVWGIDRDPDAEARGIEMMRLFPGRLKAVCGLFGDMANLLPELSAGKVDGVVFDLGVSSMQLDQAKRGFSFRADGPLDMRMSQSGMTAADAVNQLPEKELAHLIFAYGEERASRRIASAIVKARSLSPLTSALQLADLVRSVIKQSRDGIDPATRTFQALRIYINDELGELERGLSAAEFLLAPGGRLAVVSFHSLEDRKVKDFLRQRGGASPLPSRHLPSRLAGGDDKPSAPTFRLLRKGAARPSAAETAANPRARSARLRAAVRTNAPAWPLALNGERTAA